MWLLKKLVCGVRFIIKLKSPDSTMYGGPCILRPPARQEKIWFNLKVVLHGKDTYNEDLSDVTDGMS